MAQSANLSLSGLSGRLCGSNLQAVLRGDVELHRKLKKDGVVVTVTANKSTPFKLNNRPRRSKDSLKAIGKDFTLVLPIADNDAKTLQRFEDFCEGKEVASMKSSNRNTGSANAGSGARASSDAPAIRNSSTKLPQQGRMMSASSGASRNNSSSSSKGNNGASSRSNNAAPQIRAPPLKFERRDSIPSSSAPTATTPGASDADSRPQTAKVRPTSLTEQPIAKKQRHASVSAPPAALLSSPVEAMSTAQLLLQRGALEPSPHQHAATGYGQKKRSATEDNAVSSPAFALSPSSTISTPERAASAAASSSSSWRSHFSTVCSSPSAKTPQTPKSTLTSATALRSTYGSSRSSSSSGFSQLASWRASEGQRKPLQSGGSSSSSSSISRRIGGGASRLGKQPTNSTAITKCRWKKAGTCAIIPRGLGGGGDLLHRGGFANLGNTCYIAAVLSALLHQERFIRDLASPIWAHVLAAPRRQLLPSSSSTADADKALEEVHGRSAAAPFDLTTALHSESTAPSSSGDGDHLYDSSSGSSSNSEKISSGHNSESSNIPAKDGRLARCLLGVMKAFADRKEASKRAESPQRPYASGGGASGVTPLSDLLDTPPRKKAAANIPSLNLGGLKQEVERISGRFVGNHQQDAHEFLGDLINAIHDDLAPFASDIDRALVCGADIEKAASDVAGTDCAAVPSKAALPAEGPKLGTGLGTETTAPSVAPGVELARADAETRLAARAQAESTQAAALLDDSNPLLPTARAFHAEVEVTLQCACCGYERRRIEHYRDFSLDLPPPSPAVDDSLDPLTTSFSSSSSSSSSSSKMPQVPCPFFIRSTGCKEGANCKFAHSTSTNSARDKTSSSSNSSSNSSGSNSISSGSGSSSTSNNNHLFPPAVCLESLLEQFFGQETLHVDCEKCPGKTAIKSQKLAALPGTLVLHLKRFEQPNPYLQPDRFEKRTDRIGFRSQEVQQTGISCSTSSSSDSSRERCISNTRKNSRSSNTDAAQFGLLDLSQHCTEYTRNPPAATSPLATAITPPTLPLKDANATAAAAVESSKSPRSTSNEQQCLPWAKKHKSEDVATLDSPNADARANVVPISVASDDDDEFKFVDGAKSSVTSSCVDPASYYNKRTKESSGRKGVAIGEKQRWTISSGHSSSSNAYSHPSDDKRRPDSSYDVRCIPSDSSGAQLSSGAKFQGDSVVLLSYDASLRSIFELLAATRDLTFDSLEQRAEGDTWDGSNHNGSSSSSSISSGLGKLVRLVEENLNLPRDSLAPHATAISIAARRELRHLHRSENAEMSKGEVAASAAANLPLADGTSTDCLDDGEGECAGVATKESVPKGARSDEKNEVYDGAEDFATLMSEDKEEKVAVDDEEDQEEDEENEEESLLPRVQRSEELKARYQLTAVVHHLGKDAFAGHYVASARCQTADHRGDKQAKSSSAHLNNANKAPADDPAAAVVHNDDAAVVDLTSDEAPSSGSTEVQKGSRHGGWVLFDDSVTKTLEETAVKELAEESGYIYFFSALNSS